MSLRGNMTYLRYVLRHKRYVYQAGRVLGLPHHQLAVHDWSKFTPAQWAPYVRWFAEPSVIKTDAVKEAFDRAWLKHQHWEAHHWQYWVLIMDDAEMGRRFIPQPIPKRYVQEMAADWYGAGRALMPPSQTLPDTRGWYERKKTSILLHPVARLELERCLAIFHDRGMIA
jgi:hypothetical protein